MKSQEKTLNILYWFTTILGPTSFVIGGTLFLAQNPQPLGQLQHLGYPAYLLTILGFWKVGAAIAITVPRLPLLKEWAYAGFFFHLTGASASHIFAGDPIWPAGFSPLIFLGLVIASWALRPASRRLPGIPTLRKS